MAKQTLDLSTVTVDAIGKLADDVVCVIWTAPGKRFHFWFNTSAGEMHEGWIYVNPPEETPHRGEGYFDTRRLDAENKTNAPTVAAILAHIKTEKLVEAAFEAYGRIIDAQIAEADRAAREHRVKEAGPALAEALQQILAFATKQGAEMDDPHGDGTGADSRSPEGDDWNVLHSLILNIAPAALLEAGLSQTSPATSSAEIAVPQVVH